MNSSPNRVLRGHQAAQAVAYQQAALTGVATSAPVAGGASPGPIHFDEIYADQIAALKERASAEGFDAGYAEGMKAAAQAVAEVEAQARARAEAAHQSWEQKASAALSGLASAVDRLDARTAPTLEEMTTSLSETAYTLVAELLGREVGAATGRGRDAVARALRLVPGDAPVTVRLNPEDFAALSADWLAALPSHVSVVADRGVESAGAIADAGARRVDAQLSTALARVREVLDA